MDKFDAMLDRARGPLALAGRVLIAALFIPEGWSQLTGFKDTAQYIASQGVPLPEVCAALSLFAHLGLSIAIVVGWRARWAALGLALFVIVITPIFHNYWSMEGSRHAINELMFWKNAAIAGGLLVLAALGPGPWAIDKARPPA